MLQRAPPGLYHGVRESDILLCDSAHNYGSDPNLVSYELHAVGAALAGICNCLVPIGAGFFVELQGLCYSVSLALGYVFRPAKRIKRTLNKQISAQANSFLDIAPSAVRLFAICPSLACLDFTCAQG